MMSSATRGGRIYNEAMAVQINRLGITSAMSALTAAIHDLQKLPIDEPVVKDGEESIVSVSEAILHLQIRMSRLQNIKSAG